MSHSWKFVLPPVLLALVAGFWTRWEVGEKPRARDVAVTRAVSLVAVPKLEKVAAPNVRAPLDWPGYEGIAKVGERVESYAMPFEQMAWEPELMAAFPLRRGFRASHWLVLAGHWQRR